MHRAKGLTTIELLVVLAITGILAVLAAPSYLDQAALARLRGAASGASSDVSYARSEAVARGEAVRVDFSSGPAGAWCYVVYRGAATGCTCAAAGNAAATCASGSEAIKNVSGADYRGIELGTPTALGLVFEPRQGILDASSAFGDAVFTAPDGASLRMSVNGLGRARVCSPDATVTGYVPC